MQDLHARMLGALLAGEGLREVADLAAAEAGSPIAIVLPGRGIAVCTHGGADAGELSAFANRRAGDEGADLPASVEALAPVVAGGEAIGLVLALRAEGNGLPTVAIDREEVLRTTALAALTDVAVTDARDDLASEVRGTLLEDLQRGRAEPDDIVRRATRLGCDLRRGAIAIVAEVRSAKPHHAAALISGEYEGAIAQPLPGVGAASGGPARIYAILPARGGDAAPQRTAAAARALAARLKAHGPAASSSFRADPGDLGRAVAEAELMLEVIAADDRIAGQLAEGIGDGVYRLLFRAMATDADEVRRFYSETVETLVEHDREYRTDLLGTLETYLAHDCNMNATARAVYAHRHTVAHRLARIRELTKLDPALGEERERLGLGIKAYRILEPTLHR